MMRSLDCSDVGIDENGVDVGFFKSLDSLRTCVERNESHWQPAQHFSAARRLTRVIEFSSLTDTQTTRTYDEHLFYVNGR